MEDITIIDLDATTEKCYFQNDICHRRIAEKKIDEVRRFINNSK